MRILLFLIGLVTLGRGACPFQGDHPLMSCEACNIWCRDNTLEALGCGCTQAMCAGGIIPMYERIVNPQTQEVEQVLCIAHNGTDGFPILPGCICGREDNFTAFSGMDDAVCEFPTGTPVCGACDGDGIQCSTNAPVTSVPSVQFTVSPTTSPTPAPVVTTTTTTPPTPATEEPCIELNGECYHHPQHHIDSQHPGSDNNGNRVHCCDNLVCLFEPRTHANGGGRRKRTCQLIATTTTTTTTATLPTSEPTACAYDDHLHPLDSCQNCQIWCMMGHPACACDGTVCGSQAAELSSPGVCTLNGGELACACGLGGTFSGFTASNGNTCTAACSSSCPQNSVQCGHRSTTSRPTSRPTALPTTVAPTTAVPTRVPTLSPTSKSPTRRPTASPTTSPTTGRPTSAPTTVAPTPAPTRECESHAECDDGNTCTQNICNPRGQCEYPPEPCGTRCDDGLYCTGRDFCCNGECSIHGGNPCVGCSLKAHCNDETDACELPPTPAPPTAAPTELQTTVPPTPQPTQQCTPEGARCKLERYWWWQGAHDDRRRTLSDWKRQRCCAGTKCKRADDDRRAISASSRHDDDDDDNHYGTCVPSEAPSCYSIDVTEGNCCPGYTGVECDEVDKCYGIECLNGGECVPETGQCSCPPDYVGPGCALRSCGHGGWYNRGFGRCVCHRGWRGERCDECDDPGRGKTYLCVPTNKDQNIYVLAKIHTDRVQQFISGERGAHPTLHYPAIYPNSVGYRQRTYDCACRAVGNRNAGRAPALPPSATGKTQQSRISAANAVLFDMVITDCVDNSAIAAVEMDELNELWDDCLSVEQKGGVSTWFTLAIVFIAISGAALITIIVLAVLYARTSARLANSIPVDRQYQQPLIGDGYQHPPRHLPQQDQASADDSDWSFGGATKKIK